MAGERVPQFDVRSNRGTYEVNTATGSYTIIAHADANSWAKVSGGSKDLALKTRYFSTSVIAEGRCMILVDGNNPITTGDVKEIYKK